MRSSTPGGKHGLGLPVEAVNCSGDTQHQHHAPHKDACRQYFWKVEVVVGNSHSRYSFHGLDRHGNVKQQPGAYVVEACTALSAVRSSAASSTVHRLMVQLNSISHL